MRSQRLTVATNFLPFQAVRLISFLQTAVAANAFRYQAGKFPLVGNAHRAFRGGKRVNMPFGRSTGKHKIDGTNTQCNYFNPCNARPSNARFVIFCMFTVADAAGAATLRFKRLGLSHETNIRIQKNPDGLAVRDFYVYTTEGLV